MPTDDRRDDGSKSPPHGGGGGKMPPGSGGDQTTPAKRGADGGKAAGGSGLGDRTLDNEVVQQFLEQMAVEGEREERMRNATIATLNQMHNRGLGTLETTGEQSTRAYEARMRVMNTVADRIFSPSSAGAVAPPASEFGGGGGGAPKSPPIDDRAT